jgi:hypothetical protein
VWAVEKLREGTMDRTRHCQQCHETNRSNARFCRWCGGRFSTAITAFLAYANEDDELVQNVVRHLKSLELQGLLTIRTDRNIMAGAERLVELNKYLRTVEMILLLVSADLFVSDYFTEDQMRYMLRRHENGEAIVIPVILRAVDWKTTPFGALQPLPEKGRPIQSWLDKDEAFLNVAQEIRRLIKATYIP